MNTTFIFSNLLYNADCIGGKGINIVCIQSYAESVSPYRAAKFVLLP